MIEEPRIALCCASTGTMTSLTALSISAATAYFMTTPLTQGIKAQHMTTMIAASSVPCNNMHRLVHMAREWGATHIFWVEEDNTFPKDAIHRLYRHHHKWVAANYPIRRGPPYDMVATGFDGERVLTGPDSTGLQQVSYTGFGCCLMDIRIFEETEPAPWFMQPWVADKEVYGSQDWFFGQKCADAGIPIFVDHDLSKEVGHIGDHEFFAQEVYSWKQLNKE